MAENGGLVGGLIRHAASKRASIQRTAKRLLRRAIKDQGDKGPVPLSFLFLYLPESALIGLGILLPNVNDIFPGKAPDLGANEAKTDLPVYGFRA